MLCTICANDSCGDAIYRVFFSNCLSLPIKHIALYIRNILSYHFYLLTAFPPVIPSSERGGTAHLGKDGGKPDAVNRVATKVESPFLERHCCYGESRLLSPLPERMFPY